MPKQISEIIRILDAAHLQLRFIEVAADARNHRLSAVAWSTASETLTRSPRWFPLVG